MKEEWRDIKGCDGNFQVSNIGRVRSFLRDKDGRILKLSDNGRGYAVVRITYKRKKMSWKVHQLVASAFLGHTPNGNNMVVNHKDFNRKNNRLDNLEIVSSRENGNQKHMPSSSKYTGVCWDKSRNKWLAKIYINKVQCNLGRFDNEIDAHNAYQAKLAELP